MKKHYIFLLVSLAAIVSLTYYFDRDKENEFITQTERELDSLNRERDSVFHFADEVLIHIDEQQKDDSIRMSSLDDMVKSKQITIEEQVAELTFLVEKSNRMKEWAEDERDKAIEFERISKKQRMEAEVAREISALQLDSLKSLNHSLLSDIESYRVENHRLLEIISQLRDSITAPLNNSGYDNKKKKRNN